MSRKAYRDAYVSAHVSNTVASQIEAMREARGWKQGDLAEKIGTKQSRVSVLENPDNPNFELKTLLKVASAFDVALSVKFVSFSEVVEWADNISLDRLVVPEFAKDGLATAQAPIPIPFPFPAYSPFPAEAQQAVVNDAFMRMAPFSYQGNVTAVGAAAACDDIYSLLTGGSPRYKYIATLSGPVKAVVVQGGSRHNLETQKTALTVDALTQLPGQNLQQLASAYYERIQLS